MIWFWLTPLFYKLEMLSFPYRWICLFNPMTYYVIPYQNILFEAKFPPILTLATSFLIAVGFMFIGYSFFLAKEANLSKQI